MVSPVPSTSTQNPPLSYADRVKKSQGIPPSSASTSAPSATRPIPRSISTSSSSAPPPPKPAQAQASLSTGNVEIAAKEEQLAVSTDSVSKPTDTNGGLDVTHASPVGGSSSAPASKVTSPPVVNVWNVRKAQMARGLPSQPLSDPSSSTAQKHSSNPSPNTSIPPSSAASPSINGSSIPASQQNGRNAHPPADINGSDSKLKVLRDPPEQPQFAQGNTTRVPDLEDASAWPEVGKMGAAPISSGTRRGAATGKEREAHAEQKESGAEKEKEAGVAGTGPSQKKSKFASYKASRFPAVWRVVARRHRLCTPIVRPPCFTRGMIVNAKLHRWATTFCDIPVH